MTFRDKLKYLGFIFFVLFFDLLIQLVFYGDLYKILMNIMNDESLPGILASIVEILVFYLIYKKIKNHKGKEEKLEFKEICAISLSLIGMTSLWLYFSSKVLIHFDVFRKSLLEFNEGMDMTVNSSLFMTLILVSFLGPIMEELIFRGVIQEAFKKICKNELIPIILQALIFGIWHMILVQSIYCFVGGMVFGYVKEKTSSIKYPILIHMINNFLSTLIPELGIKGLDIIFQIFCVLFLFYYLYKKFEDRTKFKLKNPSKF